MQTRLPLAVGLVASGCATRGAPTFILFGSYFPAWMLCASIGVAVAIVARLVLVAGGLSDVLPFQLGLCTSMGVIVGLVTWLLCFGW